MWKSVSIGKAISRYCVSYACWSAIKLWKAVNICRSYRKESIDLFWLTGSKWWRRGREGSPRRGCFVVVGIRATLYRERIRGRRSTSLRPNHFCQVLASCRITGFQCSALPCTLPEKLFAPSSDSRPKSDSGFDFLPVTSNQFAQYFTLQHCRPEQRNDFKDYHWLKWGGRGAQPPCSYLSPLQ